MTTAEILAAWADLQAVRADQLARRARLNPQPSGRAVSLAEYLAAGQAEGAACRAHLAAPGPTTLAALDAASAARRQAGADLTPEARCALMHWLFGEGGR